LLLYPELQPEKLVEETVLFKADPEENVQALILSIFLLWGSGSRKGFYEMQRVTVRQ
jgi:hypothetical protein